MSWKDTERTARKKAKALAKRLGPKWEGEIWENLGWHWKATHENGTQIYETSYGQVCYSAFLSEPGETGATFSGSGDTPEEALRRAVELASASVRERAAALDRGVVAIGHVIEAAP